MSFLDVVWSIMIAFAFVAYLMVMFMVMTDLFRDRQASGFAKAAWILALLVFPFLTAFIYLIIRGQGMAERAARDADAMRQAQESYIRDVVGKVTPTEQIAQARAMLDSGVISPPEYDRLKEKALV
jgi:Phospholipase_D-nuclease N-terminal